MELGSRSQDETEKNYKLLYVLRRKRVRSLRQNNKEGTPKFRLKCGKRFIWESSIHAETEWINRSLSGRGEKDVTNKCLKQEKAWRTWEMECLARRWGGREKRWYRAPRLMASWEECFTFQLREKDYGLRFWVCYMCEIN